MKLRIPSFWMKEICQGACVGSVLLWSGCASFELTSIPEGAVLFEGTEQIGSTPYPFEQFSGERVFTVKNSPTPRHRFTNRPNLPRKMRKNPLRFSQFRLQFATS